VVVLSGLVTASVAVAGCGADEQKPDRQASRGSEASEPPAETQPAQPPATREVAPPAPPPPNYAAQAERAVRAYYRLLNGRDFGGAWSRLSPSLQADFGGFETWASGYDLTEGTDPESVETLSADAARATVAVTLRTDDLDICGDHVAQVFEGTWTLTRSGGSWAGESASISKTAGGNPVRDPAECPSYLPVDEPPDYVPPEGFTPSPDLAPGVPLYEPPVDFCEVHDCIPNFENGTGYPVQCADGSWSQSGGRQGACSWHGGVGGG
jgi:hypothetical protein